MYGIECQIRDDSGKAISSNEIGTLYIKGDNVMLGYYKAPELTEQILKDGWLNTGDYTALDDNNNIG